MTRVDQKKSSVTRSCRLLLILLLFGLLLTPERGEATENADQVKLPISIFVSIGAHLDFCREIGAGRVAVKLALPPGKNPATYAPAPQLIQALSRSRLYFKVGLPFETALLAKVKALPRSPEIIDAQKGIVLQPMQSDFPRHGGPHRHTGLDPHTWLDPKLALRQATVIFSTLCRIDPDGCNLYANNFKLLKNKLQELDEELKKSFIPYTGSIIFVYHPAFGYFARAFGLHQIAIELGGKKPKARELAAFIKTARAKKISALFVQPQFDQKSAAKVAQALNCAVVGIDPLAAGYCRNLKHMAAVIRKNVKSSR